MAKVDMPSNNPDQFGTKRKPGLDKRLKNVFITDSPGTVGEHIVWDVIVPGMKGMFMSALHGMIDGIFGGRSSGYYGYGGPSYNYGGASYRGHTDYSGYGKSRYDDYEEPRRRRGVDDTDFMFRSYAAAASKKNEICEYIERKGKVTVADVDYICTGRQGHSDYMDDNWGWYDVTVSNIRMIPHYYPDGGDGYCLELPRPIYFR